MLFGRTKNIKAGDAVLMPTGYGSVEVIIMRILPLGRAAVINKKGMTGIQKIMQRHQKSWYDITLLDIINERVTIDIHFVKVKNLKVIENEE